MIIYLGTDLLINMVHVQEGKTPLDVAQGNDESKESLLSVRFPSEEVETEFLQERLPQHLDKVLVSKLIMYYVHV